MNKEIVLPEEDPPQTLNERLNSAVYSASMYNQVTPIVRGHRLAYIVPAFMYEKFIEIGMNPE